MRIAVTRPALFGLMLLTSPLLACPPRYTHSTKVGVDVNGGALETGDLIEWTLTVVNSGCTADTSGPTVADLLAQGQDVETIGEGGTYDAAKREVLWDGTTTPALKGLPAMGGAAVLHLSTRVSASPPPGSLCNQASLAIGGQRIPWW